MCVAYCYECTHIGAATNSQDVMLMLYQQHKDVAKRARECEADNTKTVAAKRPRVTRKACEARRSRGVAAQYV